MSAPASGAVVTRRTRGLERVFRRRFARAGRCGSWVGRAARIPRRQRRWRGHHAARGCGGRDAETIGRLSRTPLTSLVFTLPLVLAYEGGVLRWGGDRRETAPMSGCVRSSTQCRFWPVFSAAGAHGDRAVGLAPRGARPLAFRPAVLVAWPRNAFSGLRRFCSGSPGCSTGSGRSPRRRPDGIHRPARGYCGAGLYEEVLFRLILLPLASGCSATARIRPRAAAAWAVLVSSLLFSAAHYVGPLGDTFSLYSFTFRTLAGVFFATLLRHPWLRDRCGHARGLRHARRAFVSV
jgi:hypothetical protein